MLRGWGGQSNRILVECQETREAGHYVAIAAPYMSGLIERGREQGFEVWDGYQFKPPFQVWYSMPDLFRLVKAIKKFQPDLIHVHGSQDTWLITLASFFFGKKFPPVIRSKHNSWIWKQHKLNKWMYNRIDAYISVSGFIDQQVVDYPGLAEKPHVAIHSVPDIERFRDAKPISFDEYLPKDGERPFVWIISARLRWEKAHDTLLKAAKILKDRGVNYHMIILGDGSEKGKLHQMSKDLGLWETHTTFLGFVKDVPAHFKGADGFILPSRSEGLGTAALEALCLGLPVVGSKVDGIPESVIHEKTGLLFETDNEEDLANQLQRMQDSPELREKLGQGAREHIEKNFTRPALRKKTLAFYEEILSRHANKT